MGSILGNTKIKDGIREISRRTENEGPENACESFYDCNIISHLKNKNHQIIQGRRGTGKTHILYVLKHELEATGKHCIYFDCNLTGSIASISNAKFPESYRAVQLIRDYMYFLLGDLSNYFAPLFQSADNEATFNIRRLLNQLERECKECDIIVEQETREITKNENLRSTDTNKLSLLLSKISSFGFDCSSENQREKGVVGKRNVTGIAYDQIIFTNVHNCLEKLAETAQMTFVLLIDEWSKLPTEIQPHFAEFLRRCFTSSRFYTLKIAVVTGRTKYCLRDADDIYGFEVGADIFVDMDLDKLYMFDRNPRKVNKTLYSILYKHLTSRGALEGITINDFLSMLFKDDYSAALLPRSAEGNPRDFISILDKCIIELDGQEDYAPWIDSQTIFNAAKAWYDEDKKLSLSALHKDFLSELVDWVVYKNKTRGFVIDESYLDKPAFKGLIDARILHVVQNDVYCDHTCKENRALVVLDFGTYCNCLMSNKPIHLFTSEYFENIIFSRFNPSVYSDVMRPFDKNRFFKYCLFDPELNSNLCPAYSKFDKKE